LRKSLELLVAALGHRVRTAATGEEGLALIASAVPDLALVDIGMPGIDGYEIARRIRRNPAWRGLRLVAMSGYAQPEDLLRSAQAGFDRHLAKPVDLRTLVEALGEGQDPIGEP
jgi:CheY-like chemotaxis protein